MSFFREFKPSILFLIKFLVLYFVLNLLYGLFIDSYSPKPDPVTRIVANHTSWVLKLANFESHTTEHERKPTVAIVYKEKEVLGVYEGCNALNVAIIFVSFLMAFGRPSSALIWFIPIGFLLIYLANLFRIAGLFYISIFEPEYLYFTHKFLFTAILYVVVFALWFFWIKKLYSK